MPVNTQHPVDVVRDFPIKLNDRVRKLLHFDLPLGIDFRRAGGEQHFRLEDETVAYDADIFLVRQDFTQTPEKIGAIAVQFLHTLGKGGNLAAQGCDLLVQQFHLIQRTGAHLLFRIKALRQFASAFFSRGTRAAAFVQKALQARAFAFDGGKRGLKIGNSVLHILRIAALQREKLRQFLNLAVEARKHAILVVDLAAEQELRQHENSQQKHDRQKQRRQRIDKTRPVIDMPLCAAVAGKSHGTLLRLVGTFGPVLPLAHGFGKPVERVADGLLLIGLLLHPVTHHLLFVAHAFHEALNAFGKIGKCCDGSLC